MNLRFFFDIFIYLLGENQALEGKCSKKIMIILHMYSPKYTDSIQMTILHFIILPYLGIFFPHVCSFLQNLGSDGHF